MRKKYFSWLLAFAMIISLLPALGHPAQAISGDEQAMPGMYSSNSKSWRFRNYTKEGSGCSDDTDYYSTVKMAAASLTVGDDGKFESYTPAAYSLTELGGYSGTYGNWALSASGNAETPVKAARDQINDALQSLIGRKATLNIFDEVFPAISGTAMSNPCKETSVTNAQATAYFYEPMRIEIRNSLAQSESYDPSEPPQPQDPETIPVPDDDPEDETIPLGEDGEDGYIHNPGRVHDKNGLKLSKELSEGNDGDFNLTLGTYSTANTTKLQVNEKVPTDFVVVVDQSGSMDAEDMAKAGKYQRLTTSVNLEDTKDGSYYYYDVSDDAYYRVYPVQDYLFHYYPANYWFTGNIIKRFETDLSWFMGDTDATTNFENQFYFREEDSNGKGIYDPIKMSVVGKVGTYYLKFRYVNKNGDVVIFNREDETYTNGNSPWYHNVLNGNVISPGWSIPLTLINYTTVDAAVQLLYQNDNAYTYSELELIGARTGMYVNYPMYDRHIGYTRLCYRDTNGVEHTLKSTSGLTETEFCNTDEQAITTKDGSTRMSYANLYRTTETETRLSALKSALKDFTAAVANEYDTRDNGSKTAVDNRIAIVGFSSDGYNNTELLTNTKDSFEITSGSDSSGWGNYSSSSHYSEDGKWHNGVQKATADGDTSWYANALITANVNDEIGSVNPALTDAIDAITAHGGTQPADGLKMAEQILELRSDKTHEMTTSGETKDRNTIVIFFTDGHPGNAEYSDMYSEANEVVKAALDIKQLKNDQGHPLNTAVFSIGVFGESDANPLTYPREAKDAYTEHYTGDPNDPDDPAKDIYHAAEEYYGNNRLMLKDNNLYTYEGGFVKTHPTGHDGYSYYLRRQWRPNNAEYTPKANDTIYDYMSVTSSNYPTAELFIHPDWLAGEFEDGNYVDATEGVRHDSVGSNQFYRMASNQATLVAAFQAAVTYAGEISSSSSSTSLDSHAVVKDAINTADFDISEAEYTVYKQPIRVNKDEGKVEEIGNRSVIQSTRPVPVDGEISYSGFAFDDEYVSINKDTGNKLVIEITGLRPREYNLELKSNADDENKTYYAAGIYAHGSDTPKLSIESPTLYLAKKSSYYVADFNAPLVVATDVTEEITQKEVHNGDFTKEGNKAVYRLSSGRLADAATGTVLNSSAYSEADYARITGKHVEDGANAPVTTQIVKVIPGSSVYYSDTLTEAVTIGDGSGYNASIDGETSKNAARVDNDSSTKALYFTFYGTGIDIYCTTHAGAGYINAAVFRGGKENASNATYRVDGTSTVMKNYSSEDLYNIPTLSFTLSEAGLYTVRINAVKGSQYKLDGIRVYNPTDESALVDTDEKNASYINLRRLLVNEETGFSVVNQIPTEQIPADGEFDVSGITGVLYIDNARNLVTKTLNDAGEEVNLYKSDYEAYKKTGPKNEIYLNHGNGVTFNLDMTRIQPETKAWIGLSAPKTGSATVYILGVGEVEVTSYVDMYYPITIPDTGNITITNQSDEGNIVSVTNLKITNLSEKVTQASAKRILFAPMTMRTIQLVANDGVDPEAQVEDSAEEITEDPVTNEPAVDVNTDTDEPTDDQGDEPGTGTDTGEGDTGNDTGSSNTSVTQRIIQSISNVISSVIKRISGLFGR